MGVFGALLACGTETGNPEGLVFEYNATSSDAARVSTQPDAEIQIQSVWLRLGDVAFEDCGGVEQGRLTGIGFADHSGEEAALQRIELPDVPYCTVRTEFLPDPAAIDEPPRVRGAAIGITGVLSNGADFTVVIDERIEVAVPVGAALIPEDIPWLLAFDVATWLDASVFDVPNEDGIRIDAETTPGIYADLLDRIPDGVQLYEDISENGLVDPEDPRLDP
jgi:hypothetical protein